MLAHKDAFNVPYARIDDFVSLMTNFVLILGRGCMNCWTQKLVFGSAYEH